MGRTCLRGIELAGLRLAVESSEEFNWACSGAGLENLSSVATEPDIHVGVRFGEISSPRWDPVTYSFDGGTFDVGRVGDEWWVAVHAQGRRYERLARFDRDFSQGDVTLAAGMQRGLRHPLEGPLLEWLITHALIERGGLILAGSAMLDSGSALALLSAGSQDVGAPCEGSAWDGAAPILTPGPRFAVHPVGDHFRVHGLPGLSGVGDSALGGRLRAIHVLDSAQVAQMQPLEAHDAVEAVLSCASAPVHAPELTEKILTTAACVASCVPVTRLGFPQEQPVMSFAWGCPETSLGFATPLGH